MTDAEIQRLKAAGISDAVIQDLAQEDEKKKGGPVAPGAPTPTSDLPEIDPNTPSEVFQNAQSTGVATQGSGTSWTQTGLELGAAAAPYAVPAALTGLGLYGTAKVGGWGKELLKTGQSAVEAMRERTAVDAAREARMSSGGAYGRTPTTPPAGGTPNAPVAPQTVPQTQPTGPYARRAPMPQPTSGAVPPTQPVAPQAAPQPAPAQSAGRSILQQGVDYAQKIKQLAMDRVIQPAAQGLRAAAPYATGLPGQAAVGITSAIMPGNVGQNYPFPQVGPLKGQEINPNTGRPWTKQELAQYNAQYQG